MHTVLDLVGLGNTDVWPQNIVFLSPSLSQSGDSVGDSGQVSTVCDGKCGPCDQRLEIVRSERGFPLVMSSAGLRSEVTYRHCSGDVSSCISQILVPANTL